MTIEFVPAPNPHRDYLEGRIDLDEFGDIAAPPVFAGPSARTFEDWTVAARDWASRRPELDLWPFQIEKFASATAWLYEGATITPGFLAEAWDVYVSGQSPYSPYTVSLEGYDYDLWHRKMVSEAREKLVVEAIAQGAEGPELDRLLALWDADADDTSVYSKRDIRVWVKDWFTGKNPASPHHVPLDPVNVQERIAEVERVSQMECYRNIPEWKSLAQSERPSFPNVKGLTDITLEDLLG